MGGCCQICHYNKCQDALEFHHLDPTQKDYSFGRMRACPRSIATLTNELKKCILLCSCCHKEVHAGVTSIPETYAILNEDKLLSENELKRRLKQQEGYNVRTKEPVDRRKIFLTKAQLIDLLNNECKGNKSALARYLKVSETAIRKHLMDTNV